MEYVIGIDGGGTKTVAVLVDMNGNLISSATVGATNPNVTEEEEIRNRFKHLIELLYRKDQEALVKTKRLFAGVSGTGLEQTRIKVEQIITSILPSHIKVRVESDSINALYSGTYGKPGIVQIAGTGSITYGINSEGNEHRVGGWGYLLGDEGSGYDIGRRGIIAVLKSEEGRAESTLLTELLFQHFQVTAGRNLIEKVYNTAQPKEKISPLSKIVFQAYKEKDGVAERILEEVGQEICSSIISVYHQLFRNDELIEAVLCGGVFNDEDILPPLIKNHLEDQPSPITICLPTMAPIGGSVIKALLQQRSVVNEKVIHNIMRTINTKLS